MDAAIQSRLTRSEEELLSALTTGEESLFSYEKNWLSLQQDISHASNIGQLSDETLTIAHTVASRILKIVDCFLNIRDKHQYFTSQFHGDLEDVLQGCLLDVSPREPAVNPPAEKTAFQRSQDAPSLPLPQFIAPAYSWLLDNIHNPYPPPETKSLLARESGSSLTPINAWFTSVRRRMGWTKICRNHFGNSRVDTVNAAYRVLVKADSTRHLPAEVTQGFISMKVTAEGLYSSLFSKSAFANELDSVVKGMGERDCLQRKAMETLGGAEERGRTTTKKLKRKAQGISEKEVSYNSYPSPTPSRSISPVPTLEVSLSDEDSEVEDDVIPPTLAGSKRSVSCLESYPSTSLGRPHKRLRSTSTDQMGHPSPPWSHASVIPFLEDPSVEPNESYRRGPTLPEIRSTTRKRRLSVAESPSPRWPRIAVTGPRLHAASDPLPKSFNSDELDVDSWFNVNFKALFDVPDPVELTDLDPLAPCEVELFSHYVFPQPRMDNVLDLRGAVSPYPALLSSAHSLSDAGDFGAVDKRKELESPFLSLSSSSNALTPTSPSDVMIAHWSDFLSPHAVLADPGSASFSDMDNFCQSLPELDLCL